MNDFKVLYNKASVPVYVKILNEYCEDLKKNIINHRKNFPVSNKSNVKAWHSSWATHEETTDFNFFSKIVIDEVSSIYNVEELTIDSMWAMMYEKSDHAVPHNHFPSEYVAIYYVDVETGCSPIVFQYGLMVIPENGMLLIFPGRLRHEVPPTDKKRMLISWNLVTPGDKSSELEFASYGVFGS